MELIFQKGKPSSKSFLEVIEGPLEINHNIEGLNLSEEKLKDISKED